MRLIDRLAQHPLAANLMMLTALVAGIWGLGQLHTQFLPPFEFKIITVRTTWVGASPEDVERSITTPLEQELRNVDFLKEMTSTSALGVSSIVLEFETQTDIKTVLDQVKEKVNQVDTLPADADRPIVTEKIFYETIAKLIIYGFNDLGETRRLIRDMEQSLLDSGIAKVNIRGLPEEELAIQIPTERLYELGMPLNQVAEAVRGQSQDTPAGTVGRNVVARQLRAEEQRREAQPFDELIVNVDSQGRMLQLGEIAQIKRRPRLDETLIFKQGKPAIELTVLRTSDSDALGNAEILESWLQETRPQLPQGVKISVVDERWTLIADRIRLLLENGFSGLILVVAILYLFLNSRVAFWVAAGIPTVFLATLAIMAVSGQSINMLSLFALIMVLGVVVDDAIVVGEEALSLYEQGEPPLRACTLAAHKMKAAVVSSSLTTIAAFMPLMLLTDLMGDVLFIIPLVVIIVLTCSLFEAFFILPGHLYHALKKPFKPNPAWRDKFEVKYNAFKEKYAAFLEVTLRNRGLTFSATFAIFLISLGLVAGGRVPFTFFPSPEANKVTGYVQFVSGTPPQRVADFLNQMEIALYQANDELGGDLVVDALLYQNLAFSENTERNDKGSEFGTVFVELTEPDSRTTRNPDFIKLWLSHLKIPAYVESLNIESPKTGPPGIDIDIELTGGSPEVLKAAAVELNEAIRRYVGVYNVEDDLPFGRTQWILKLTPMGRTLGLSVEDISTQIRSAFEGQIVQKFYDYEDEIEVRVMLPDAERHTFARFHNFPVVTPTGQVVPLSNVVNLETKVGMQALRHTDSRLAVHVTGEVDSKIANANQILQTLKDDVLPEIVEKYNLRWSFEGTSKDEERALSEMQSGSLLGLAMIYLILCAILSSYTWPLIVLAAIPFGITGAIVGHGILGIDLTLLSLFGLFGLAGIVINDSIILILTYFTHREKGLSVHDAALHAGRDRLRAVLLTSLTTIGGLMPLLFETSLQAQFLIPMAASLVFGLMFSTALVLIVLPSLIVWSEEVREKVPAHVERLEALLKALAQWLWVQGKLQATRLWMHLKNSRH